MRLSFESQRARWLLMTGAWIVAAMQILLAAAGVRAHLDQVAEHGLRGGAPTTPFAGAYLSGAVDAQEWVEHATSLVEHPAAQLRHTDNDNAPAGRDVHWNTAWAWTIGLAGVTERAMTHEPTPRAVERATLWLNPLVLFVILTVCSAYAARRAGALAGLCVVLALMGHDPFNDGFTSGFVDHHGLLTAAILGMMLGAVFMHTDAERRRQAAIVSAMCGALGMWISAASVAVPIAIVGASGVIAALFCVRSNGGDADSADMWRTWGRVGAAATFFAYVLEYFPTHLSMHLEVNHPLYALAWLGGGELVAEIVARHNGARAQSTARTVSAVVLVLLAPVTILLARGAVFAPLDPFLGRLYHEYLTDFSSLWQLREGLRWNPYYSIVGMENIPLIVGLGFFIARGRRTPTMVAFATVATLAFTIMAWIQMRWLVNASGAQICLALVLAAHFVAHRAPKIRWAAALGSFAVLFAPSALNRVVEARSLARSETIAPKEEMFMLYRDVAATIRASQPEGKITLLTDPNASISIGYYGRFSTIGTAFWENIAGLRGAAEIYSAQSDDNALQLLSARGVTHIAVISRDDFTPAYVQLLNPNATDGDFEATFGYRLMTSPAGPAWLEEIPYAMPRDLSLSDVVVRVFRIVPDQSPIDALEHFARAALDGGRFPAAAYVYDSLVAIRPNSPTALLGQSAVRFAQGNWTLALDAALKGIALSNVAERVGISSTIGNDFFAQGRMREAAAVYRAGLDAAFDPDVACALSLVLSTAQDDAVRRGPEALALARRAMASRPESPSNLNCLGAALAETGAFGDAVAAVARSGDLARANGDVAGARMADALLGSFRAGRPWRD